MRGRPWSRDELVLAMNVYCQLPFGRLNKSTLEIIRLASVLGRTPSSVSMKLCNFASLDPALQARGVKGLTGASKADRAVWEEFHRDWLALSVESEGLCERYGLKDPADVRPPELPEWEGGDTDTASVVKVRRAQRFFRQSVLASYDSKCCVTGIAVPQLLVASHILPWSGFPESRTDPRNGLCLSRLHDAAFDRGLISFDEEFRLILSGNLRDAATNAVLATSFAAYEGKSIDLPERFLPRADFLERHRREVYCEN